VISPVAHANKNPAVVSRLCNLLQHAQDDAVDPNVPREPVLARGYHYLPTAEIDVLPFGPVLLALPQPGIQSNFKLREVLRVVLYDHGPYSIFFVCRVFVQVAYPFNGAFPMAYQTRRIEGYSLVADPSR